MVAQTPIVGWKEVRNRELSEVVTRRLAAGMLPDKILREVAAKWSHEVLPGNCQAWTSNLARVLEQWGDGELLTPASLHETIARWLGVLRIDQIPLSESKCQTLLDVPFFKDLADILRYRELPDAAGLLPEPRRKAIQDGWLARGWIAEGENPLVQLASDQRANDLDSLDRRAREDLLSAIRAAKVEKIRSLLDECSRTSSVPFALLQLSLPEREAAGNPSGYVTSTEEDDPVLREYTATAGKEWRNDDVGLALDALLWEVLMREHVSHDLVGLALSGGGIRSASFNLGILQALQKDLALRDLDFLSTVSGGGYVGSFLSSSIHGKDVHLNPDKGKELLLAPDANGKQPQNVLKLVRSGSFLNNPTLHLSRYFLGVLLNNFVLFSSLVALCTFIALVWRFLDVYPVEAHLRYWSGGWVKDWIRPFLPSLALLSVWFVVSASYLALRGPHGHPRFGPLLLKFVAVTFLIGTAVALATPNLEIPMVTTASSHHEMAVQFLTIGNTPVVVLLIVALLGLIPFLRPWRFLASGTQPGGMGERLVFRMFSLVLLIGIPFFVVYVIARHDVGHNLGGAVDTSKRIHLHPTDIHYTRWNGFWTRLIAQAKNEPNSIGASVWKRLTEADKNNIRDSLTDNSIPILPIPLDEQAKQTKEEIVAALNSKVLDQPSFAIEVLGDEAGNFEGYVRKRSESMIEGQRLRSLLDRYRQGRYVDADLQNMNRLILEAYYSWAVWERGVVRRSIVIDQDQAFRGYVLLISMAVALTSSLLVGLNSTSLHGIYRQQLAWLYLNPVAQPKREPYLRLQELDTTSKGGPYHIITGSLDKGTEREKDGRPTVQFLFSPRFCGSTYTGFVATKDYLKDKEGGTLDLATAMAISGAAFSPARVENRLIAFLMLVLNARLGQWLPSPRHPARVRRLPVLRLLSSLLLYRGVKQRRYWFVTDGGHSENLGLGPLIRRECKLIVVSDAGYDPDYGFDDFVKLYRHARANGVQFQTIDESGFIRMDSLVPDKASGLSPHRYVIARIKYPGAEKKSGLLIYVKPSFAGDESVDLVRYRRLNSNFPHDPTSNQWFDEDQVESYRELGAWIGQRMCEAIQPSLQARRDRPLDFDSVIRALEADAKQRAAERAASASAEPSPISAQPHTTLVPSVARPSNPVQVSGRPELAALNHEQPSVLERV